MAGRRATRLAVHERQLDRAGPDDGGGNQRAKGATTSAGSAAATCYGARGSPSPKRAPTWAALTATAVRDGDEYVINGTKVWTSYAQKAEFCFLLARTEPGATGNDGISIFLVRWPRPG